MVDIQTVSAVAAAMSVAISAVIGVIQFGNLVKTRQAQFFIDIYNKFCERIY
jgi:hypothetical protein